MSEPENPWLKQPAQVREALEIGWASGVPSASSALYSRWWQLETWLRSLIYVELRSAYGADWTDQLLPLSLGRQEKDQEFRYMETPDAQARLAYSDARALCSVIESNWDLFGSALLARSVWAGRMEELLAIRNRIGHCRRPHADDLGRLEQTLRDLEPGARRATKQYHEREYIDPKKTMDFVFSAWGKGKHPNAGLIDHADRQYETTFKLECSRRHWSEPRGDAEVISGRRGYLWHATWFCRGDGSFNLRRLWEDIEPLGNQLILVCADGPNSLDISFSALEDPELVAELIAKCFDAALSNWDRGWTPELGRAWTEMHADLDPRVHTSTAWALAVPPRYKIKIFGA